MGDSSLPSAIRQDDPVERVLTELERVTGHKPKRSANGWMAYCPAHDDKSPSLSVACGDSGVVLLTCHAGCSTETICRTLGIRQADLFPRPRKSTATNGRRIVATYPYHDEREGLLFEVVRYEPKDFRQRRPDGKGGWLWNLQGVRRILYRLPELLKTPTESWVFIVEGEKDADQLALLGLVATTNPGGAGKWKHVDDTALHRRRLCVLPDNDGPGRQHADDVGRRLHGKAAEIRILDLSALPDKGDVSDWLNTGHTTAELLKLVEQAPAYTPTRPAEPDHTPVLPSEWEAPIPFGTFDLPEFPQEAFPSGLRTLCVFCAGVAESYQVPFDLPAILVLAVGAAALAKRIEVHVRGDWVEPVNTFAAIAMLSGERKTGVFRAVTAPLVEFERTENERLAPEIERNRIDGEILAATIKHAQAQAAKAGDSEARTKMREQAHESSEQLAGMKVLYALQLIADDATPEALSKAINEQGGRIALLSPEGDVFDLMAGRYSDGLPRLGVYLKGHAGDDLRVNRVGRAPEFVNRPALTVGLAIQPSVLCGLTEKPGFRGRGLLARFLYSLPVSYVGYRDLNPAPVPIATARTYSDLIHAALLLPADTRPVRVSAAALAQLDIFRDRIERALRADGELAGIQDWGNKLPGAVCRIAGIFHGLTYAARGDPAEHEIDTETMLCAVAIGEYLIEHAKAAFFQMEADTATGLARRLLSWITEERLTEFSWRDAFNRLRGSVHRTDEIAEPINLLKEHGYIRDRPVERSGAGRKPSPRYEVNPLLLTHNEHNAQNREAGDNSAYSAHCAPEDAP